MKERDGEQEFDFFVGLLIKSLPRISSAGKVLNDSRDPKNTLELPHIWHTGSQHPRHLFMFLHNAGDKIGASFIIKFFIEIVN